MLGISYGELFLLLGATAAFIANALLGHKDLPRISRTAGRLAGHAIGYFRMARGQFESVMKQSQAQQLHKELEDTMAQLEAICHEIRTISFMNPAPLTTRLVDNIDHTSATATNGDSLLEKIERENILTTPPSKDSSLATSSSSNFCSEAPAHARLAKSAALKSGSINNKVVNELADESGLLVLLPVLAESTGLLLNCRDDSRGSDLVLEAIVEAEVAHNAKDFFCQPQNQIKPE